MNCNSIINYRERERERVKGEKIQRSKESLEREREGRRGEGRRKKKIWKIRKSRNRRQTANQTPISCKVVVLLWYPVMVDYIHVYHHSLCITFTRKLLVFSSRTTKPINNFFPFTN